MQPNLGYRRLGFGVFLPTKYILEPILELEEYGKC